MAALRPAPRAAIGDRGTAAVCHGSRRPSYLSSPSPCWQQALTDPYFRGLSKPEREPSCQPIGKMEFDFEHSRVSKDDIRELIFQEILEYHPQLLKSYIDGTERTTFLYPSVVDHFKKQFSHLEESDGSGPVVPADRKHASLPREIS